MSFITGKHVARRTMLQGLGATVALPFLDAMVPARGLFAGSATAASVDSRCEFLLVEPGPMTFPGESFDVVLSSGAIMQIEDKQQLFKDALRVLKPGGALTSYDWMKPEGEFSEDMLYWFKMERLTYDMKTFAEYETLLRDAGFTEIEMSDRSDWYRRKVQDEYQQIQTELYPRMVERLGKQEADHFVENWRAMTVV